MVGKDFRVDQDARRAWDAQQLTDAADRASTVEAQIASRVLTAMWVEMDHPLVPTKARGLTQLLGRPARARLSVLASDRDGGRTKTVVTVVWRGGFCSWVNGAPDYGVLSAGGGALLKCSYTRIMGILRGDDHG